MADARPSGSTVSMYPGGAVTLQGGSFGRINGTVEYGAKKGPVDFFVAGNFLDEDGWRAVLVEDTRRMLRVFDHPKPIVASVHGYCLAGGVDLMLATDLCVAADDAVFGYVDVRFGSGVVSMFLPWVVGARAAKELLLTGADRVPATEAHRIGLVGFIVGTFLAIWSGWRYIRQYKDVVFSDADR